jgi:hypothetical protein
VTGSLNHAVYLLVIISPDWLVDFSVTSTPHPLKKMRSAVPLMLIDAICCLPVCASISLCDFSLAF